MKKNLVLFISFVVLAFVFGLSVLFSFSLSLDTHAKESSTELTNMDLMEEEASMGKKMTERSELLKGNGLDTGKTGDTEIKLPTSEEDVKNNYKLSKEAGISDSSEIGKGLESLLSNNSFIQESTTAPEFHNSENTKNNFAEMQGTISELFNSGNSSMNSGEVMAGMKNTIASLNAGDGSTGASTGLNGIPLSDFLSSYSDMDLGNGVTLSKMTNSSNLFDSKAFCKMYGNKKQDSFSTMFKNLTGIQVSDSQLIDTSAFGKAVDQSLVNLQYQTMLSDMNKTASKTKVKNTSGGATSVFKSNYGDLASKVQLKKAKIPSGFNTSSMFKSASSSVKSAYKSQLGSSSFSNIKNKINISSSIGSAKNLNVSQKSLASDSDLRQMVSSLSSNNKSSIASEFQGNKSNIVGPGGELQKAQKSASEFLNKTNNKLQTKFKESKKRENDMIPPYKKIGRESNEGGYIDKYSAGAAMGNDNRKKLSNKIKKILK